MLKREFFLFQNETKRHPLFMAAADALEHEKNKVVEICKKFLQDSFFFSYYT